MSLNKKKMVREIGRRTRLKNQNVQAVIETLIDIWTEELVAGGRIEIEGFLTIRIKVDSETLPTETKASIRRRILVNAGNRLWHKLNGA